MPPLAPPRLIASALVVMAALLLLSQRTAAQTCAPAPPGLVSWYPADGDSGDLVGGNHGALSGGASFTSGKAGQAFNLNGSNGAVIVPDAPSLRLTNSLTIEAWVNLRSYSAEFAPVVSKWNDIQVQNRAYLLAVLPDGRLRFDLSTNGQFGTSFSPFLGGTVNSVTVVSSVSIPLNTPTHVVATFDGATRTQRVFINGVERGSATTPFSTIFSNTEPLLIGAADAGANVRDFTNGWIDEVRIFSRALGASEIQSISNAGSASLCRTANTYFGLVNFLPGNGNPYDYRREANAALNAPIAQPYAPGKVDLAFNFDGSGNSVSVNTAALGSLSELTVEAWVQTGATTADFQAVVSATNQAFVHLQLNGAGIIVVYTDAGAISLPIIPQTPTGVWRHIALSAKSGNTRLYVNGELFASSAATFSHITPSQAIRIGAGFGGGRPFRGQIDEVSIYNRALSQSEVQAVYNLGGTGKSEPANDDFYNAKTVAGVSGNLTLDYARATKESGEPSHAGVIGGASVWYRWVAPASGPVYFDTNGSTFDTILAAYTGSSLSGLTEVASNDDAGGTKSRIMFNAVAGQEYRIAVDGAHGQSGALKLKWSMILSISGRTLRQSFCNSNYADPVGGLTVTLGGGASATTVSDANGFYSFTGLPLGRVYTVSAPGFLTELDTQPLFDNALVNLIDLANCTGFHDITITVSGAISAASGANYSGITVNLLDLTGTVIRSTVTTSTGFTFPNLPVGGSYIVVPVNRTATALYSITPASIPLANLLNNELGVKFQITQIADIQVASYFISGFVTDANSKPLSGVLVTLSGSKSATTQTDANGAYSFDVAPGGDYTITPTAGGLTFRQANAVFGKLSGDQKNVNFTSSPVPAVAFVSAAENLSEGAGSFTINVYRTGETGAASSVHYATVDKPYAPCKNLAGVAQQNCDYLTASGTLNFAPGETTKSFQVILVDDNYVEGDETLALSLSAPAGATLGGSATITLTIKDNDTSAPTANPFDDASYFVRQHYYDFLSRVPDAGGLGYWSSQITTCGDDKDCVNGKRVSVSNAFFFEIEYQQTGAYVFRLYRAAFGNSQPFPNPDTSNLAEAKKYPSYAVFSQDRAGVVGGDKLAQTQLDLANQFVQRAEFLAKYPAALDGTQFVDAVLSNIKNDVGVDLSSQRAALISLFNSGGRGAVIYRLADDNAQSNPIDNRAFIDAEYNRAFVATQYFGYLRRDADIGGLLFWLNQVNRFPLRSTTIQNAMVCSFITSDEYQFRFSSVVTHSNKECPQ